MVAKGAPPTGKPRRAQPPRAFCNCVGAGLAAQDALPRQQAGIEIGQVGKCGGHGGSSSTRTEQREAQSCFNAAVDKHVGTNAILEGHPIY